MDWEAQLILIYLTVCEFFMQEDIRHTIRKSPNASPIFTDEEVMTIYIFGILSGHRTNKQSHQFVYVHLKKWFPYLPKYSTFNHRLNLLMVEFSQFCDRFIYNFRSKSHHPENLIVLDSMPIMLAKGSRSGKAKVARNTANLGYCASKKVFYHGVKFHLFADYVEGALPNPHLLNITGARQHDLPAVKNLFEEFVNYKIIADKAYCDGELKSDLASKSIELHTPYKLTKTKKELTEHEALYTKIINSFRQSIEIFFSWIIKVSGVQDGSRIRSEKGLGVHVFGRFAAAMILLLARID